jgi:hypothetical protein
MVIIMDLKYLKENSKINIEKIEEFVPGKLYYKNNTESTNLDAKLTENVPDKSDQQADAVGESNEFYEYWVHIWYKYQDRKTDEEDCCAYLSGHQCAIQRLAFPIVEQCGKKLEEFLGQEKNQDRAHHGVAHAQADGQYKLGKFISDGVQKLAQRRDHIIFPGNLTIHHVGQTGSGKNSAGKPVFPGLVGIEIDIYIDRDQCQPEQAKQIGNIPNILFPVFHGCILRQRIWFIYTISTISLLYAF